MKKILFLLITSLFLLLAACGGAEESGSEEGMVIGMTVINQEALFFTEMVKGAEEKAEELGIELIVHDSNNDQIEQNNAIENFITEGVDAIIVNAYDPVSLNPVIEKASEEGISIISIDSVIENDAVDVQIGVDNGEESKRLAEYFNEYASEQWEGGQDIGVITALNSPIQINRQDSFIDTLENSEVVDVFDGENVQEQALTAAENLINANEGLEAVFVTGEPAFIGAVSAVGTQQKEDDIKLFGWDLSPQVVRGIDEGFVEAVIQQHPDQFGAEAVQSAQELFNGSEVESLIEVPATIVTDENIDEYRSLFE